MRRDANLGTALNGRVAGLAFGTISLFLMATPAVACGWWGDAEAVASREAAIAEADAPERLAVAGAAALPGGGYALAVTGPDHAVPYRDLTGDGTTARIADMAGLGFKTVVDLTPSAEEAKAHRARTGETMRYHHLGQEGEVPTDDAIARFRAVIRAEDSLPLLVYAPTPTELGTLWALSLMAGGTAAETAIATARTLGLDRTAEAALWWHLRNGRLRHTGFAD